MATPTIALENSEFPTIKIENVSVAVGEITTTTITAYNVTNFSNYGITIRFDSSVLAVNNIIFNPVMGASIFEQNTSDGHIKTYTLNVGDSIGSFPNQSGNILLSTLELQSVGSLGAISPLEIEIGKTVHTNNTEFSAIPVNGIFTITDTQHVGGEPTVKIDNVSSQPGETTTATITAYNVADFSNYGITVRFDPEVVEITNAVLNPSMIAVSFENNVTGGYARLYTLNLGLPFDFFPNRGGNVTLATFELLAVGDSGTESPLDIEIRKMIHTNNSVFSATSIDGIFTINTATTLTGDVNGDGILSSVDALMALQMSAGNIAEDLAADVSGDGSVTSLDALMILQASVGAIVL